MRVLVCGGRSFNDTARVAHELALLHQEHGVNLAVMHGGAAGADELAANWCRANGVCEMLFPAPWNWFGRMAGPVRNEWMLRHGKPDLVLAFPGGLGTADMVRQACKANVRVLAVFCG